MKKIVIVNVHWNNRGDEAALMAIVNSLLAEYDDINVSILFIDDKEIQQFPELENVKYFSAKINSNPWKIWLSVITRGKICFDRTLEKSISIIKKSDLIIYGPGGSVLNKRFWWKKQLQFLMPFICSKLFDIPMMVCAPSIGPFNTKNNNWILKYFLKVPKVLCVREEISKKYLNQIGIEDNVSVTIDSAFLDDIDKEENELILQSYTELNEFLNKFDKIVGITITDFDWHVVYNKNSKLKNDIKASFTSFIDYLSKNNFGVIFIPQLFGNQNDFDYMNSFRTENSFIISDDKSSNFQQYIISKLHSVVGMRYHSNIFAAKMKIPFIAIIYEEKMEGFIKIAGLEHCSLPLLDISFKKILKRFNYLNENYDLIADSLNDKQIGWQKKEKKIILLLKNNFFK